jgi:hypothetical protein
MGTLVSYFEVREADFLLTPRIVIGRPAPKAETAVAHKHNHSLPFTDRKSKHAILVQGHTKSNPAFLGRYSYTIDAIGNCLNKRD